MSSEELQGISVGASNMQVDMTPFFMQQLFLTLLRISNCNTVQKCLAQEKGELMNISAERNSL